MASLTTDVDKVTAELGSAGLDEKDDWGELAAAEDEAGETGTSATEENTVASEGKKPSAKGAKRKPKPKTMRAAGLDDEGDIPDAEEIQIAAGASELFTDIKWSDKPIEGLPDFLYENMIKKLGFRLLTKVQYETIPPILAGHDVIAQGKNGSGKTAAFFAGVLSKVDPAVEAPQVIVIANSRELAVQEYLVCRKIVSGVKITIRKVLTYTKGTRDPQEGIDRKKFTQHVLICTAGKVKEKLEQAKKRKKDGLYLKEVRAIVLDEADDLITNPHVKEVLSAMRRENEKRKGSKPIQLISFSATYSQSKDGNTLEALQKNCRDGYHCFGKDNPDIILKAVEQYRATYATPEHCARILQVFLEAGVEAMQAVLIFVKTIKEGVFYRTALSQAGIAVGTVWGGRKGQPDAMDANERDQAMNDFKVQKTTVLIATDALSRGVDLDNVYHVFMIGMPSGKRIDIKGGGQKTVFDAEGYLQRVGRTGRLGKVGTSVVLIPPSDGTTDDMEKIVDVQNKYECEIKELPPFPDGVEELPDDWYDLLNRR